MSFSRKGWATVSVISELRAQVRNRPNGPWGSDRRADIIADLANEEMYVMVVSRHLKW